MNSPSDKKEFLAMLEQHKRIIFKVCNSYCKVPESRKDVAQEIVIQLWNSYEKYDPQYKLSTWVYRVALNVAISFYRREKKHTTTSVLDNAFDISDDDQHSHEADSNIALLHQFIGQLDQLHKALMILYLDNNTYQDIAAILGITETNVATKINRVKQKLKQHFEAIKNN